MVSKAARKNLKKKSPVKKTLEKKEIKVKPVTGYVIVTGRTVTKMIRGKKYTLSRSKVGTKIFKASRFAKKMIDKIRNETRGSQIKALALRPRVNKYIIRDPLTIARLKKAKEFIIR